MAARHSSPEGEKSPENQTATQMSLKAEPVVMDKSTRDNGEGIGSQIQTVIDVSGMEQGRIPIPDSWNIKTVQAATQKLKKNGYDVANKTVKDGTVKHRYVAFYNNPVLAAEQKVKEDKTE